MSSWRSRPSSLLFSSFDTRVVRYALLVSITHFVVSAEAQESSPPGPDGSAGEEAPREEAPHEDAVEPSDPAAPKPAPEPNAPMEAKPGEPAPSAPNDVTSSTEGDGSVTDVVDEPVAPASESSEVAPPVEGEPEPVVETVGEAEIVVDAGDEAVVDAGEGAEPVPETEVVVRGPTIVEGVDRSTRAVTIVDLQRARVESADMGAVLSRVEGVNVQRGGGLGSEARFSLAGFDELQVRFFVDGVPLEFAGYPFGFQNVPVNFGERVEVYKGVVPLLLGTDALGGAFNLVTDRRTNGTKAVASYEFGSFGYHRLSGGIRHRDAATGLFGKVEAFLDRADNDYPILVDVADRTGVISPTRVYRFHDQYRAGGGNVEVGYVDKPWARRLLLRAFVTDYSKDIQHNAIMTRPYGEAREGSFTSGASLRYENNFGDEVTARAVGGYMYARYDFVDTTECIYNWFGQCANTRVRPGEIGFTASDLSVWDHAGFFRGSVDWNLHPDHRLRFATSPTYYDRSGDNRLNDNNDPTAAQRNMLKWVSGVEHEAQFFDGALSNLLFVKSYVQNVTSEATTSGGTTYRGVDRVLWGVGDGLRYDVLDWLFVKASYEYATRLPESRELFGNGGIVIENLRLEPERSHNVNLTLALDELTGKRGSFDGNVTGFARETEQLISLFPLGEIYRYDNVNQARSVGVEGALGWTAPGEWLELGGNVTFQEFVNKSETGPLVEFRGERVPNRPYFWANLRARLQKREFAAPGDTLSFTWRSRYVHDFFLNWAGAGRKGPDDSVPSQLTHGAVLTYLTPTSVAGQMSFSAEVQNITDEMTFDFFGVQRPGRAGYFKVTYLY